MILLSPKSGSFVGGYVRFVFNQPVSNLKVRINSEETHTTFVNEIYEVDMNHLPSDLPLHIQLHYHIHGVTDEEEIVVYKPRHDLAGMGATVIRNAAGDITGTFFKFWLPEVSEVYVRGSFNSWMDRNKLQQLGNSGYWYGFATDARPGNDYRFYVYTRDNKNMEVSDPAARQTLKTVHNNTDVNNANCVITDPAAFPWLYDGYYEQERRDFSKYIIYQCHWGTFMQVNGGGYLQFVSGDDDEAKRMSVREKLTYIASLGFTVLQLLPVNEANGNNNVGYDPSFFFAVESTYGKPDDLRMLVDEAHGMGLAVIFDVVINHLTSIKEYSSFSQEFIKGWYTRENAPWSNEIQFPGNADWGPDPDHWRKEIRELLTDNIRMYFNEFHADGVRFDATKAFPYDALKIMIHQLQGEYGPKRKYFIAEHIDDQPFQYIVGETGFNATWLRPAWNRWVSNIAGMRAKGDIEDLRYIFETNYAGEPSTSIKYLLGSHDENWRSHRGTSLLLRLGGNQNAYARAKMRLTWSLNVCLLGTPMLFMGTETMNNVTWENGYYNVPADFWLPAPGSHGALFKKMMADINQLFLSLGAFRRSNRECQVVHHDPQNGVLAYKRWDNEGSVVLIVINISDAKWQQYNYRLGTSIPSGRWQEIFNSQAAVYGGDVDSGNFFPVQANGDGTLPGINLPSWSLLLFKQLL